MKEIRKEDLIRTKELEDGSIIWNADKAQRDLIRAHSFWDIRDGNSALFWEDGWQQLPPLQS